ncbi:glycosyltransferase [Kocuria rosea]|uniref:glycosyltransferase n=1 Tax=Kocuria rosea TaxID=1275 RepID=UPI003D334B99
MTQRVVIVQPYVPAYRVPFFERLRQALADQGVDCIVAAGVPRGDQAGRGDSVRPDWLIPIQQKTLTVGMRSLDLSVRPAPWRHTDAVILGLEGSSMPVYQSLLMARAAGVRVGLWGHVHSYVAPGHPVDLWLETLQMRLADRIFAYTPGGAADAMRRGVPGEKVTTVMNTVDTATLKHACEISERRIDRISYPGEGQRRHTFSFIGGLDSSKRIAFLAEALDILWGEDPRIRLLVGGAGAERALLDPAVERGQVVDLGPVDTRRKANALVYSRAILMPGRIGLVAVDALVARRPILTTDWPWHAPESEYLVEGISRVTSPNDPRAYAEMVLRIAQLAPAPESADSWEYPTLDEMTRRYAGGVVDLLGTTS